MVSFHKLDYVLIKLHLHCAPDIWSSDIWSFRLYGQFLAGPKMNGISHNKIFRIYASFMIEVPGLVFLAQKVAFSWLSVDRFGQKFGGLMTLGQVKSVPNFC